MKQTTRQTMKAVQIRLIVFVTSFLLSTVSLAQTAAQAIQSGKGKLMRGDYKGAEVDLSKALKTSKTRKDQSDAFKFLGISQFMQNKKPLAERSFKQALIANPNASINVNEVADESVVPYFNQLKVKSSRQKPAANPTVLAKPSSAPSKPGVSASRKALLDRQAKRAVVTIISNAPNADILKDGISIGPPGNPMDFDPGTLVLEVHAPGFISKAIKLQLKAGTTSTAKVDLQKKQPKAVPKTIPLPNATASGQGRSPGSMGLSAGGKKPVQKAKASGTDLFGEDPVDEMMNEQPMGGQQRQLGQSPYSAPLPQVQPPAAPQQPLLPQGAYMTPPMTPVYPQQPYYQQPMYQQQPIYQQQPYYPPQQQMMPQQPYYQQPPAYPPQQPAPPSVYAPYGGPGYPPQSAAPVDPYSSGGLSPPIEPLPPSMGPTDMGPPSVESEKITGPPPMKPPKKIASGKSKSTGKNSSSKSSCNPLIKVLPFGAGQFCQGSTFKGVLFAGVQVGALYFYKQNSDAAANFSGQLDELKATRSAERETIPEDEQEAYDATTAQKEQDAQGVIKTANDNAQMSLIMFVGAWGVGVVDATLFAPTPKKAKKKMRFSLLLPDQGHDETTLALLNPISLHNLEGKTNLDWYLGVSQTEAKKWDTIRSATGPSSNIKLGLAWNL